MAQPSDDHSDRVWDLIEKIGVCMLTTRSAHGLRARPVEARTDRSAGLIWFVTDLRGTKDDEIDANPDVGLTFIDHSDRVYLSVSARATVHDDHTKAAEIWAKTDNVWWSGPHDPNVRVLRIEPRLAELWDGPSSSIVTAFEFAKARLTGDRPNLGENRKVTVPLR
jgi:general stress protein 26